MLTRSRVGLTVFLLCLAALAIPSITVADNCSDWTIGELVSCPNYVMWRALGMLAATVIAVAGAIDRWNSGAAPPEEPPPPPPPPPLIGPISDSVTPRVNPDGAPAYDPGQIGPI